MGESIKIQISHNQFENMQLFESISFGWSDCKAILLYPLPFFHGNNGIQRKNFLLLYTVHTAYLMQSDFMPAICSYAVLFGG